MSKYVIELRPGCKVVQQICESDGQVSIGSRSIEYLEELNADYINEHYGELQDTAYHKGLEEGNDIGYKDGVIDGRNEAWECGKKLAWTAKYGGYGERLNDVFGRDDTFDFYDYTPNEAIEKLKAFEQKQDKIEVGDEVNWMGDCFIVTRIFQPRTQKEQCDGIDDDGCVYHDVLMDDLEKTGRHFDIASILEDMRHD